MGIPYNCNQRKKPRRVRALARLEELVKHYGKLLQDSIPDELPEFEVNRKNSISRKLNIAKTNAANTLKNLGGFRT